MKEYVIISKKLLQGKLNEANEELENIPIYQESRIVWLNAEIKMCKLLLSQSIPLDIDDYKYTLYKLVNATDEFIKQINIYPHTLDTFKDLEKADLELNISLSLAKEFLDSMQ